MPDALRAFGSAGRASRKSRTTRDPAGRRPRRRGPGPRCAPIRLASGVAPASRHPASSPDSYQPLALPRPVQTNRPGLTRRAVRQKSTPSGAADRHVDAPALTQEAAATARHGSRSRARRRRARPRNRRETSDPISRQPPERRRRTVGTPPSGTRPLVSRSARRRCRQLLIDRLVSGNPAAVDRRDGHVRVVALAVISY